MWRHLLPLVLSVAALAGCSRGRVRGGDAGLGRAIAAADVIFAARADPAEAERALRAYLDLETRAPDDPRVLWRLARAYTLRGYRSSGPEGSLDLVTGRGYALRCLMLQSEFAGVVHGAGGVVTPAALVNLDAPTLPCVAWAAVSWGRWAHARGVSGVAMDVNVIEGLGDRTLALGGEDFGSGRALAIHGVTASLRPTLTGEGWDAAEESLRKATALAPERLTPKVDLALYVLRPQGRDAELRALLQEVLDHPLVDGDPNRPENERAKARARDALGVTGSD